MADVSAPCRSTPTLHGRNSFENRKWRKTSNGQENPPRDRAQKSQRGNQVAWKDRHRGQNRPDYLRLDSTGENSASSSEDLNGGFSPEIQFEAANPCRSRPRSRPQPQEHRPFTDSTYQGGGLLDRVRSVFVAPQRNASRNLTQRTPANNAEARLASLDSVAEKFTNMSMTTNMNPQPWGNSMPYWQQHHASGFGGPTHHSAQGQWGQTVPHDRNHTPIFHPYQGMAQPPLLTSTQNYQRNLYSPPWLRMMGGSHPSYPPFNQGFHYIAQPWHHQQRPHPPFPWQQWVGPQMMPGCHNHQGSMALQQRARSPTKKQRWNHHGNQQRTSPQSRAKPGGCPADKSKPGSPQTRLQTPSNNESSVDQPAHISEVKDDDILSKKETIVDKRKEVVHNVDGDSAIYSSEGSVKSEQKEEHIAIQNENIEYQNTSKLEVGEMPATEKPESKAIPFQRHSSIDLILSDYEVQSSTQVTALPISSDSEDSIGGSDSDSAVETNADLWESFTSTDDPYNPLCGWRCNDNSIQENCSGVPSSIRDCHIDSGTDEGDNWSETDSDDDYDSGDDIPDDDDDVDAGLPQSLQLSAPQLLKLKENLSSTPKEKSSDRAPVHHPSVAFILGSTSSSSEDDDDWDTLDDTSTLQDNPLWDSFNRARDPYSPMEAWKCHASNLSSAATPPNPSQTTPMRKQDSVEGIRTFLLASTEQTLSQPREESLPGDSDGESFAIATVRVYAARDDIDLGSPTVSVVAMKRVASASCLRRIQLTPQNKAIKKVRFCPNSSFIILVEKDPPRSCGNNPSPASENDWQACARDRMRFKARIDQLSHILDPILTDAHRERVCAARMAMEGYR